MAQSRGRGWHGDSEGHAQAGRKGGQARQRQNRSKMGSGSGNKGGQASMGSTNSHRSGSDMGSRARSDQDSES